MWNIHICKIDFYTYQPVLSISKKLCYSLSHKSGDFDRMKNGWYTIIRMLQKLTIIVNDNNYISYIY